MLEQETSCVFSRTLASLNTRSLSRRHETSGSVSELEVLQSFPPVVFFPCFSFFSPAPVASSLKLQLLPGCRAAKLSCGACAFTVLIQSSSFSVFFYCFFFFSTSAASHQHRRRMEFEEEETRLGLNKSKIIFTKHTRLNGLYGSKF